MRCHPYHRKYREFDRGRERGALHPEWVLGNVLEEQGMCVSGVTSQERG